VTFPYLSVEVFCGALTRRGSSRLASEVQFSNAEADKDNVLLPFSPKVTSVRLAQSLKALLPITVTFLPM